MIRKIATHVASAGLAVFVLLSIQSRSNLSEAAVETRTNTRYEQTSRSNDVVERVREVWNAPSANTSGVRNLFAYRESISKKPAYVLNPKIIAKDDPPLAMNVQEPLREPNFPYAYVGTFGPDTNPIAVFVGNSEVVNARVGERITNEFRLRSVGIESAEVISGSGASRRVALRP